MEYNITRLQPGQEELAQNLAHEFKKGRSADMKNFLHSDSNVLIAAVDGEKPIGLALGYRVERIDGRGGMMVFYELDVLAEYRRRGVGRALVKKLMNTSREIGCIRMFLLTNEGNRPAMELFASLGGQRGNRDDVLFEFPLTPPEE